MPGGVLMNLNSGKCLDIEGGCHGTQMILFPCKGDANQRWKFGQNAMTSSCENKCVDIPAGNKMDGTVVGVNKCNNMPNQQWGFSTLSNIMAPEYGKCLEVPNVQPQDGTAVVLRMCKSSKQQQWMYVNGLIIHRSIGMCLTFDGATAIVQACIGSASQTWDASEESLVNLATGACLDVGGNMNGGFHVILDECNDASSQRWIVFGSVRRAVAFAGGGGQEL
mmetsp:Transcript_7436/g.14699  ORF Transcript_7436/g.14699 Transcript_7436/m.14699 type:complete len:222 (-) Transcript_7436:109-774(-)